MKRIYNYMLLAIMALATAGCAEEMDKDFPSAESGDEVQFGLSLPGLTRTIYGEKSGSAYPIYWVNGDKVQIISPNCLADRNNAEYKVSVSSATQNYATSLTPTGDYGVQWGDQAAVFYSVYPSGEYTISDDGSTIKNLKINFSDDFEVIDGIVTPKQADCLMFAKTDEIAVGETVKLTYSPIATAVMFTLNGPGDNDQSANHEHTIQSIKLIAPENTHIAGNFDVKLAISEDNPGKYVWTNWVEGGEKSNVITAQLFDKTTGEFHKIKKGEQIRMSLFLAPLENLAITNDWKIEILVQTDIVDKDEQGNDETLTVNKTFRKSLGMKNEDGSTVGTTLKPGMVHELPALPNLDVSGGTEWEVGNWMENIPRNVYLSEVSIPGSWNTLNKEFQGNNPTISGQYANGVRGFHLDTRWQGGGSALRPTVSNVLGVANGGDTVEYEDGGRVMTDSDNPSVEDALDEIIENVKTDEYMILICTFAQGSYNHSYTSEGITYDWVGEISRICAQKEAVFDAKQLNQNTLVGDVLGKIIVIINTEGAITSVPSNSKCLFVNIPMKLTSGQFGTALNDNNIGGINKGTANSTAISDTGIDMYNTQAQVCIAGETYTDSQDRSDVDGRGFAPTFGERKTVANNILSWSKMNYGTENYAHDKWIYLGLGGYYVSYSKGVFGFGAGWKAANNGHSNVASDLNTWIDGKVTEMGTIPTGQTVKVPYYPVGIVLMNFVNNYASTVKNILMLNNAYRLQYDPNKPSDYNPNATPQSAAASYSSGMNDSNVAAFGWD